MARHEKEYVFTSLARFTLGACVQGGTLVLNVPWSDGDFNETVPLSSGV